MQAYDEDQPGTNNSRLSFSLLPRAYSHNFSVGPDTGLLRNLGPLDREAIDPALDGRIVLTVRVADGGVPVLSTEVNVTITVEVRPGSARVRGQDGPRIGGLPNRRPAPHLRPALPFAARWVGDVCSQADRLGSWLPGGVALGNCSTSPGPKVPRL